MLHRSFVYSIYDHEGCRTPHSQSALINFKRLGRTPSGAACPTAESHARTYPDVAPGIQYKSTRKGDVVQNTAASCTIRSTGSLTAGPAP